MLINFSQDEDSVKEMIKLNCANRVFDFLKQNVKADMQAPQENSAEYNKEDNVF